MTEYSLGRQIQEDLTSMLSRLMKTEILIIRKFWMTKIMKFLLWFQMVSFQETLPSSWEEKGRKNNF